MDNLLDLFSHIRVFIFDMDGVLTDGNVLATEDGQLLRSINIKDVYALSHAARKGYTIWVMTAGISEPLQKRFTDMGISVYSDVKDKAALLNELVATTQHTFNSMLYMGDDIPDVEAMQICLLPTCPNDAVNEVRSVAKYISPKNGGKGCVRDVIEKVLRLHADWQ
ncbi:MAG: 3-deoxy-D-manno-octulosonate 8-phosphate phosphatase [Sphingobacteriales bacterium]|nr:MAG: 3-deoxy-D-manno-octulosonate 8-phosphate phosphatase [Sphingobacteriales bacterium]